MPSLFSFVSQDLAELEDFLLEEGLEIGGQDPLPKEEWFTPEAGLLTVKTLITHLANNPSTLPDVEAIIEDLQKFETVLASIAEKKTLRHFAIDF
ncbi:MAG: hypothetical protein ACREPB_01995 [Arenimonas sp.]